MSENKKFDYYENVTNNAIGNMSGFKLDEAGWKVSVPVNGATGFTYTPDSRILLMLKQQGVQNNDPRFFTFKQIQELGYAIKYGARSTTVVAVKTRDDNGNFIPFDQQPKHFESVFHASDVEQHIYKTDAQGNKIPYLDRNGNPRFSRDGRQLYQYEIKPIPPFEEAKKWQVDISSEKADAIFKATDKFAELRERYADDVLQAICTFSKMTLAAETNVQLLANELDIKAISSQLNNDHKLFTECVRQAGQLTKAFKDDLKQELSKQKEVDEEIPFDIPDEKIQDKAVEERTTIQDTVDSRPEVISDNANKAEAFMNTIGNNVVEICFESMKVHGMNEGEMLAVLDAIRDHGAELVKNRDNMQSADISRNR